MPNSRRRAIERLRRLPLIGVLAITACAVSPLQPDRSATAPTLEGFGESRFTITTRSDAAQRLFRQGVLQAYAFDEKEAVRQFKAALAADPSCAMCAWGVAWQLGPTINAPTRREMPEPATYVQHALANASGVTTRERGLIDAMAVRYGAVPKAGLRAEAAAAPSLGAICGSGSASAQRVDARDLAYAERMQALVQAHPDDADVLALSAEATLITLREAWWNDTTGQPLPAINDLVAGLERGLASQPTHTGLNHYLIHAADSNAGAARALVAADRLATLAPKAPHLVHMPSHTWVRVGRHADAAATNARALAVENELVQKLQAGGYSRGVDWTGHNAHFLWYAALMTGSGEAALQSARRFAGNVRGQHPYVDYLRSLPAITLLRLERWPTLLDEPLPSVDRPMARLLSLQARGVAEARLGRTDAARATLAEVEAAEQSVLVKVRSLQDGSPPVLRDIARSAVHRLKAEVALAAGQFDDALAEQGRSMAAARNVDDQEPPRLAAGSALVLADMQLAAGRAGAAEATYRADLQRHPGSGWALAGLARTLAAQGKDAEAQAVRVQLERVWGQADPALKAVRTKG